MKKLFPLIILALCSCDNNDQPCTKDVLPSAWTSLDQVQLQTDKNAIDAYLKDHSITAQTHESGLRYVITQAGTGNPPSCLETQISFTYEGRFMTSGAVFDSSTDPIKYPIDNLILGWKIGILKMNKGAKATFYIPSGLGYGPHAVGNIPANSNLIFDITLVNY